MFSVVDPLVASTVYSFVIFRVFSLGGGFFISGAVAPLISPVYRTPFVNVIARKPKMVSCMCLEVLHRMRGNPMAIDTVKFRSPPIDEGTAAFLERQCILKQGIELETGEILYEITTGNLEGSWDNRIMFKVCREDWVVTPQGGRPQQVPCPPFVIVECSLHKFFYGQNVYGNPVNFQLLAAMFIDMLGEIMGNDHEMFHHAEKWQVRRVDWAEMFALSPAAQSQWFRMLKNVSFPRRAVKEAKYSTAVHYPGVFTTFRGLRQRPRIQASWPARPTSGPRQKSAKIGWTNHRKAYRRHRQPQGARQPRRLQIHRTHTKSHPASCQQPPAGGSPDQCRQAAPRLRGTLSPRLGNH
jgi:hypothetical protein